MKRCYRATDTVGAVGAGDLLLGRPLLERSEVATHCLFVADPCR